MGMQFRFLAACSVLFALLLLTTCSTSSSSSSGSSLLFVTTVGDSMVTSFGVDLSSGRLSTNGSGVATGSTPSSILVAPSGNALFVANTGTCSQPCTPSGSISSYTINSNGTLAAAGSAKPAGFATASMTTDSGGHFLFVANLGSQNPPPGPNPAVGTISVFSIQGTTLAEVAGSPFQAVGAPAEVTTCRSDAPQPLCPGPAAVSVTPDGKFLYVANRFDGTVTQYQVDTASGALTLKLFYTVGTAPSATAITPDGGFLYVANSSSTSNSISGFAICNQVITSCADANHPDGTLTPVPSSPFSSGSNPVSIAIAPSGKFLFVAAQQSNEISQFKIGTSNGVLTANSPPAASTPSNPVWVAVRAGTAVVSATGGTTDFLYVANTGAANISVLSFDSTVGTLGVDGPAVTTAVQPSSVAVK